MIMDSLRLASALLVLAGAFFTLVAATGLVRLPDLFSRMHAASKAGAVGAGLLLVASGCGSGEAGLTLRALAGFFFLVLTSPVSAHLLARSAIMAGMNPDQQRRRHRGKSRKG